MTDVIVIGAGHNGLAAAFYLAKGGLKPLVLEARADVGGGATTSEIHPGFRCSALSHEVLLHAQVVRDMGLARHGLELLAPAARVCALSPDGPPLVLHDDAAASAASILLLDGKAASAYVRYREAVDKVAAVLATIIEAPPPAIDNPGTADLWNLLKTGRRFRALGKRDGYRLLRWLPMPVADFVDEWFSNDLLGAAIAGAGVSGTMLGPRSAGSALVMFLREAHRQLAGGSSIQVKGGPGALTRAMAAAAADAGADIRTATPVERILIRDERVSGVVAGGREIPARAVVSAIDPKTTFLRLIDPMDLAPDFASKMRNYRASGTLAKINLALSALPRFQGVASPQALSGRIHIGPDIDYLERAFDHAKYGEVSSAPWLDVTIPSILDPQLAPEGAHVASVYVHCAPYSMRNGDWDAARQALLASSLKVLEASAPGFGSLVVNAQVLTPRDIERDFGFGGGHVFHGELAPDQLFAMRPLLGYGKYDSPVRQLYLCSGGTHPGGFLSGASGRLAAQEILRRPRI
jgi:phytoene dehydrogenase-like protein